MALAPGRHTEQDRPISRAVLLGLAYTSERYQAPDRLRRLDHDLGDAFMSASMQTRSNIDALGALVDGADGVTVNPTTDELDAAEALARRLDGKGQTPPDTQRFLRAVHALRQIEQAIVTKLGALRAISFRTVTPLGSDVYIAHFANGSAEWRIGLTKDGTIARIALGPQS